MKQDMILILDLGSENNAATARELRALGVYSEIHPHDITEQQLTALPNVKGIILNGGPNRVVDGIEIKASEAVFKSNLPVLSIDYEGNGPLPADESECRRILSDFIFKQCKAVANWNMENFISDQVELIRRQVGDKKSLTSSVWWS